jgi:tRNA 2-thiouridine synthesizing protein B
MPILYILHRSPYCSLEMENALKLARAGDGIALTQDAVLALRSTPEGVNIEEAARKGVKVYPLKTDMDARSIKVTPFVQPIDYDVLIELLSEYDGTFS